MEDYLLRKDIDKFKYFLDQLEALMLTKYNIGDLDLEQMFDNFYDKSEIQEIITTSTEWETILEDTDETTGVSVLLESNGINVRLIASGTDIEHTTSYVSQHTISADYLGYFPATPIYTVANNVEYRFRYNSASPNTGYFEIKSRSGGTITQDINCTLNWTI